MKKSLINRISWLFRECRLAQTSLLGMLLRRIFFKINGKDIISAGNVAIAGWRNIETRGTLSCGMLFNSLASPKDHTQILCKGKILVSSGFDLCRGVRLYVGKKGVCRLGSGYIGPFSRVLCEHEVVIGENCKISWDVLIMDESYHEISGGNKRGGGEKVCIGDNVWIGAGVKILPGAKIPSNSVVAAGAVVTRRFDEEGILIGGIPAKTIRAGISWGDRPVSYWSERSNM